MSVEIDLVLEKKRNKKNLVSLFSFSNGKLILTLLIEVVTLHMRLSVVYVWGTGFQKFILRLLGDGRGLGLQKGFENLLQVFFDILGDSRSCGKDDSNKKLCLWGFSGLVKKF